MQAHRHHHGGGHAEDKRSLSTNFGARGAHYTTGMRRSGGSIMGAIVFILP